MIVKKIYVKWFTITYLLLLYVYLYFVSIDFLLLYILLYQRTRDINMIMNHPV